MVTWIIGIASTLCTVSIIYLYRSVKKLQGEQKFSAHMSDAWRAVAKMNAGD